MTASTPFIVEATMRYTNPDPVPVPPDAFETQPTPGPRHRRPGTISVLAIVCGVLAILAGVVWMTVGPKLADKMDSGIQACGAMSQGRGPDGKPTASPGANDQPKQWTPEEYRKVRSMFSDSRHDDIKAAGTRLVDDVYTLNLFGVKGSWAALNLACTNHGYPLPDPTS